MSKTTEDALREALETIRADKGGLCRGTCGKCAGLKQYASRDHDERCAVGIASRALAATPREPQEAGFKAGMLRAAELVRTFGPGEATAFIAERIVAHASFEAPREPVTEGERGCRVYDARDSLAYREATDEPADRPKTTKEPRK